MAASAAEMEFEKEASKAYERFASVAKRYHFTFRRPAITCDAKPCMVFMGNHSSGKSTLINWILGEQVQDTGLAPTDDGFTVIMYGERGEFRGQAALDHLPAEFKEFGKFGEKFLHGLCVKLRPIDFLKNVSLIDSPGMIDSAEQSAGRDYDFEGVVRALVELCDMVFYLFDPEKPGTTGETVSIFAKCLSGVKFKLHILLNKCDGFSSMYDFARTYGTLCWNLSSVLETKDMPKIWTIYSGETRDGERGTLDFADFNKHRDEFKSVVCDGAARRRDNILSQTSSDFRGLSIRMRILNNVWRRCFTWQAVSWVFTLLLSTVPAALFYFKRGPGTWTNVAGIALGLLVLGGGFFLARFAACVARAFSADQIDEVFKEEYGGEIAVGTRDDIVKAWQEMRAETVKIIQSVELDLPLFGKFCCERLESARSRLNAIASNVKN